MNEKRFSVVVILAVALAALTATPVAAQDGGGGGSGDMGIGAIVDALTGLINTIAKPVAILGLAGWGLGKFAAPFAPEINSKFQNYGQNLVFGAVLVLFATQIADFLFGLGG